MNVVGANSEKEIANKLNEHPFTKNTYTADIVKCLIGKLTVVVPEGYMIMIPDTHPIFKDSIYIVFIKTDVNIEIEELYKKHLNVNSSKPSQKSILLVNGMMKGIFDVKQFYSNIDFHSIGGTHLLDYIDRNPESFLTQKVGIRVSTIDRLKIEVVPIKFKF